MNYNLINMKKIKLSKNDVLRLAKMLQIDIDEKEIKTLHQQLLETLKYVENLNEIDTSGVRESASSLFMNNVFFDDGMVNKRGLTLDEVFKNTKSRFKNYFVSKKIL